MAKRDILKEAIADAKAVKETAIANAKAALEEAFTPQLKSMLAAKLEEMELEEEKEPVAEMGMKYSEDDDKKKMKEGYHDASEEDDSKMEEGMHDKSEEDDSKMEEGMHDKSEEDDSKMEEEINLDEILAELEGELNEEDKDKKDMKEEEISEDEHEEMDMEVEDEEIDLEDMTDDDLKDFIEDVIADMVKSGELEAGDNFEEEDEMEVVDDEEEVDVEISEKMKDDKDKMEEAAGNPISTSVKAGSKNKYDEDFKKAVKDDLANLMKKLGLKEEELDEAYTTIESLKSDLNEVNLLNAKLLYTNKIFKAKTLTESQKVKVLGAFDKASTVKESKLVYETLNEGLKTKKLPIKESLGAASKVTGNVNTKKPIIETDPMVERFKKLAGLK